MVNYSEEQSLVLVWVQILDQYEHFSRFLLVWVQKMDRYEHLMATVRLTDKLPGSVLVVQVDFDVRFQEGFVDGRGVGTGE